MLIWSEVYCLNFIEMKKDVLLYFKQANILISNNDILKSPLCNQPMSAPVNLYIRNTLRQRQDGRHFPDDIFKCIFLNENVWISIKISLKFVSSVESILF